MFHQEKFLDRLTEQMTLNGLDYKALSKALSISASTVYNLRSGRYQTPSTRVLFALIEYFNCSADYLLGLIDFPSDCVTYHSPLASYGARIRELLKEREETQKVFIENMKLSSNLAYKWLSDKTLPSVEYLIKLAEYFEMSVDSFIQRVY